MLNWLFPNKDLRKLLNRTKKIKIEGAVFFIRKINPLDYAAGCNVLLQSFNTYQIGKKPDQIVDEASVKKVKAHYVDTFMSGVVSPQLSRDKDDPKAIWVEDLFKDWGIAEKLYTAIYEYSYGKKKSIRSL